MPHAHEAMLSDFSNTGIV